MENGWFKSCSQHACKSTLVTNRATKGRELTRLLRCWKISEKCWRADLHSLQLASRRLVRTPASAFILSLSLSRLLFCLSFWSLLGKRIFLSLISVLAPNTAPLSHMGKHPHTERERASKKRTKKFNIIENLSWPWACFHLCMDRYASWWMSMVIITGHDPPQLDAVTSGHTQTHRPL